MASLHRSCPGGRTWCLRSRHRLLAQREPQRNNHTSDNRAVSTDQLSPVARQHVERAIDSLVDEFEGVYPRDAVERVMEDSVRQLASRAEVEDFVPTLAHRFTRERLRAFGRQRDAEGAAAEVLF